MPRFFLSPADLDGLSQGAVVTISGDDARHISLALRMRVGDVITLCNGKGTEYDGTLISLSPTAVEAELSKPRKSKSEMPVTVTLYQGLAKGDKMDTIIQKAVELGDRRGTIVICCGQGAWEDDAKADARALQAQFERLGVPAWVDLWGEDVNHDWAWWEKQFPYHVGKILGC